MVIDDGVNNSFLRIDDGVVAVFVVRRIDGVGLRNDKTDPNLPLPRAVDCTADESKGGAVAELVARNASNPGNRGRLAARMPDGGFLMSPKVRLDRRRRGGIGRSRGSIAGISSRSCAG